MTHGKSDGLCWNRKDISTQQSGYFCVNTNTFTDSDTYCRKFFVLISLHNIQAVHLQTVSLQLGSEAASSVVLSFKSSYLASSVSTVVLASCITLLSIWLLQKNQHQIN